MLRLKCDFGLFFGCSFSLYICRCYIWRFFSFLKVIFFGLNPGRNAGVFLILTDKYGKTSCPVGFFFTLIPAIIILAFALKRDCPANSLDSRATRTYTRSRRVRRAWNLRGFPETCRAGRRRSVVRHSGRSTNCERTSSYGARNHHSACKRYVVTRERGC